MLLWLVRPMAIYYGNKHLVKVKKDITNIIYYLSLSLNQACGEGSTSLEKTDQGYGLRS